jgi:hypothetical protein
MPRANPGSKSVPRAEIDQRMRDARLRLERIERLLVPRAAATSPWLKRALCLFSFRGYGKGVRGYRTRRLLRNRRPSRMPQIHHGMIGAWGSF